MGCFPVSLRRGEPSVERAHSRLGALRLRTQKLEPLWNLSHHCERLENCVAKISLRNFNRLVGGRARTRTLDPLIKSHRVPPSAYFDAPRRISVRYWFEAAIRCELNRCTAIIFTQFHLPMLTLRFPGRLRVDPMAKKKLTKSAVESLAPSDHASYGTRHCPASAFV